MPDPLPEQGIAGHGPHMLTGTWLSGVDVMLALLGLAILVGMYHALEADHLADKHRAHPAA